MKKLLHQLKVLLDQCSVCRSPLSAEVLSIHNKAMRHYDKLDESMCGVELQILLETIETHSQDVRMQLQLEI